MYAAPAVPVPGTIAPEITDLLRAELEQFHGSPDDDHDESFTHSSAFLKPLPLPSVRSAEHGASVLSMSVSSPGGAIGRRIPKITVGRREGVPLKPRAGSDTNRARAPPPVPPPVPQTTTTPATLCGLCGFGLGTARAGCHSAAAQGLRPPGGETKDDGKTWGEKAEDMVNPSIDGLSSVFSSASEDGKEVGDGGGEEVGKNIVPVPAAAATFSVETSVVAEYSLRCENPGLGGARGGGEQEWGPAVFPPFLTPRRPYLDIEMWTSSGGLGGGGGAGSAGGVVEGLSRPSPPTPHPVSYPRGPMPPHCPPQLPQYEVRGDEVHSIARPSEEVVRAAEWRPCPWDGGGGGGTHRPPLTTLQVRQVQERRFRVVVRHEELPSFPKAEFYQGP